MNKEKVIALKFCIPVQRYHAAYSTSIIYSVRHSISFLFKMRKRSMSYFEIVLTTMSLCVRLIAVYSVTC